MSRQPLVVSLASLLILAFVVPTVLFTGPRVAYAQQPPSPLAVPTAGSGFNDFVQTVKSILTQVQGYTSMVATVADHVNTYYLQPLAFVMSGQLMKALTASVMQFVIGKANGTGIPQFVTDVRKSLQSISDAQAQAYFRQVSLTNSPFATSIARALQIDYNQNTTLAGYWAKNMSTLGQGIPSYQPGFLAGNWSQGGVAAWFQLTTQSQNNPYLLYQNSREQLASVIGPGVGGATGARLQELQWGQGFMSWCSPSKDEATNAVYTRFVACVAQCKSDDISCQEDCQQGSSTAGNVGINPGDPCTKEDGTPGTIQTPGSTIKATLDKVLGGQQDKLVQMGNISSQVNRILSDIGTVLNTINLASNILGGSGGGLLNAGSPSGALTTWGTAKQAPTVNPTTINYFGTGGAQIQLDSENSAVTAATKISTSTTLTPADFGLDDTSGTSSSDMLGRIQKYGTAWNAIGSVASTTESTLQTVMTTCHAYWNTTTSYETSAQNVISFTVTPVLTEAAGIPAILAAARAQYDLVRNSSTTAPTYDAEVQKLNTMKPTGADVATAEYNATARGAATANPIGSYSVSGGSIVDRLNLIRNNAKAIQTASCTTPPDTGGGGI